MEKFKYLGVSVTSTNDIREEIKRRINMGHACYYSLEKIWSSRLLCKKLKVNTYKTIILLVLLYGCQTWSLTLREVHRLRVFENKVFRKIFGAKRDEITGEWRKLHNAKLYALYFSSNIIWNFKSRRLWWTGHVARMEPVKTCNRYTVIFWKIWHLFVIVTIPSRTYMCETTDCRCYCAFRHDHSLIKSTFLTYNKLIYTAL